MKHSAAAPPHAPILDQFERWNARAARPRTTVYDFRKAAQRFAALRPGLTLERIAVADVEAFKQSLVAEKLSAGTANKQLGALAAMLEWAVAEGRLKANPARGIKVPATRAKKLRLGFAPEELRAILGSPIYAAGERPLAGAGPAAYWIPLVALYTGARLGEIGALEVDAVRETDGIKHLDMPTEHSRPTTTRDRRRVPLHGDLLKLGFLQFVEMQRRAGERKLFPDLRADNKGKLTGNWSKWFARYLRTVVGVRDKRKTFDSLRHTFDEACERARLAPAIRDLLMGRRTRRSARLEAPLSELDDAIGRLEFKLSE